jgi:rhodanese-related sulfurtransferase
VKPSGLTTRGQSPQPASVYYPQRVFTRLGKLPADSSKQADAWITLEVPMPDRRTSLRSSFLTRLPRSAGAALVVAFVLFAGGYAAGHEAQRASSLVSSPLELVAEPLAGGVGIVTPAQVLAADPNTVQLIDVRSREAYDFSHVTGAIAMPEAEMVQQVGSLPTDRTLVLYCTCPDEKTSLRAGRTLAGVFHVAHIVVLKGGLDAYAAAGGAVTNADPDSAIEHQGCGCSSNAPAYKLWAVNMATERLKEEQAAQEQK